MRDATTAGSEAGGSSPALNRMLLMLITFADDLASSPLNQYVDTKIWHNDRQSFFSCADARYFYE
jgi:hypothetical protein